MKNLVCDVCGATVKPRGIGSHMRLKHGVIIKKTVKKDGGMIEERRLGAFVAKKEEVIEQRVNPSIYFDDEVIKRLNPVHPTAELIRRLNGEIYKAVWFYCNNCGVTFLVYVGVSSKGVVRNKIPEIGYCGQCYQNYKEGLIDSQGILALPD